MRLIDADKVLDRAIPVRGEYDNSLPFEAVPVGYIKGAPTVEAKLIIRAKWLWSFGYDEMSPHWYCSNCRWATYEPFADKFFDYCPHCGAHMER